MSNPLDTPAAHIGDVARAKWREMIAAYTLRSATDADALANYCQLWQTVAECNKVLDECGYTTPGVNGTIRPHPCVRTRDNAINGMKSLAKILDALRKPVEDVAKNADEDRFFNRNAG